MQYNGFHLERKKTKNTKSSNECKITMDESAEKVENAMTTISNIVMHEMTHPDELHENALYRYFLGEDGSEMKHIQEDFEVKLTLTVKSRPAASVAVPSSHGISLRVSPTKRRRSFHHPEERR